MSRYTVFLPAPSFSGLKRDVRRTWVVEEHDCDIPDHHPGAHLSNPNMEIDEGLLNDNEERASHERHVSATPLNSVETPGIKEESMGDASALLFSQRLSKLYDGAVLRDDDLDEEYAFSQLDEISRDSGELFDTYRMRLLILYPKIVETYDWSTSVRDPAISTQGSMASLGQPDGHEVPPPSIYSQPLESRDTSMEDESSADATRDSSDASIVRLPTFGIPINRLASLKHLMQPNSAREMSNSKKISVLAGIVDIDGPDYIRIKKGVDAGLEVALSKIVIGDEDGGICKVTVWRDLAEEWGQLLNRSDVVLFRGGT